LRTVGPVFVTAEAPKTAKLAAAPSVGEIAWSGRADTSNNGPANERDITRMVEIVKTFSLCILFGLLQKIEESQNHFGEWIVMISSKKL
jgi:hypothetical protein